VHTPAQARPSAGAVVLALALPPLLLHRHYNPGFAFGLGSTSVNVELSDLASLAVAVAAVAEGRRRGWAPLLLGRTLWLAAGTLLALVGAATLWGPLVTDGYPLAASLVSAAKFAEYAVLAVAVPLLLRRLIDVVPGVVVLVAWSAVATGVALLQLIGAIGNFNNVPAGRRMPSFLGYHDFGALSGVTLAAALGVVVLGVTSGRWRRVLVVAAVAGALGTIIAGSLATVGGVVVAAAAALAIAAGRRDLTARRAAVVGALVAVVLAGTLTLRSGDVADFVGFLGSKNEERSGIETYSQRTVLAYIGVRIFLDHPLIGSGWQGSFVPASFEPYLDDARRRFPDVSAQALPSRAHPWGVQNAYVQAAADLGILGLALIVALIAIGLLSAASRAARAAPPTAAVALGAGLAIVVCASAWAALGLVPGVPATALLWLSLGVAVASPADE
jgi:O-antigen ligase